MSEQNLTINIPRSGLQWIAILLLLGGAVVLGGSVLTRSEEAKLRTRIGWLLAREEYQAAGELTEQLLHQAPGDAYGLLFAGEIAGHEQDVDVATESYRQLLADANFEVRQRALRRLGERCFFKGDLWQAEQYLREALALNPRDPKANHLLAHILHLEGRTWEALPFIEEQVRQGVFVVDELVMLASPESLITEDVNYSGLHPNETLLQLGRARIEALQNMNESALGRLQRVLQEYPELGEAQGTYGLVLLGLGKHAEFDLWRQQLPKAAMSHPTVWQALGAAAHERGDRSEAIRCYTAVLKRHPFHGVAAYQLGQELSQLGEQELAEVFSARSRKITELFTLAGDLRSTRDPKMTQRVSELLKELGRTLEAQGWADMTRRFDPQATWYSAVLNTGPSQQCATGIMIPELDRVAELAIISPATQVPRVVASASSQAAVPIRFEELAQQAGIQFQFDIGKPADSGMEHIFETTGGGVGVLDFDLDGMPDLYFSQARNWQTEPDAQTLPDHFYRNLGDERFIEVAAHAGMREVGFSQGVTTGDLNSDGLPDIYVCNLGENSCFINNGDGTFTEDAMSLGISSDLWSLSAAIADVNGDNFADLYVVNYLNKQEVAERACKHAGQLRACAPTMFSGAQDRLFLSDGAGGFQDATETSGIVQADGKGLGIIVADFFNDGQLEIYVGNDTAANFFFVRQTITAEGVPVFVNQAIERGLAYNDQGQVQATMGMAAADVNGDHLLDLFATNFYQDANTLYLQSPDHYFQEATRRSNLYDAGFNMLGFGTQFIDSNRSGVLDIVVTNGHVDRSFATGEPDLMRPQFFRNRGQSKFEEVTDGSLGSYFNETMLGRGMARVDWNNDGLDDFVVTHLDRAAALLTNRTETGNHFLQLTLIGRTSARTPIGAQVEVGLVGGQRITRQLLAGDGYQVRNDSRLNIGLGEGEIEAVTIRWPAGEEQQLLEISRDHRWTVVEGIGEFDCP